MAGLFSSNNLIGKPSEQSVKCNNSQKNGNPMYMQQKINGDEKQLANHRFAARHNISHMGGQGRNGDSQEHRRSSPDQNVSISSSNSSFFRKNKQSTASMCIRLKEKEQYQKLLQLQTAHAAPWGPKTSSFHTPEPSAELISSKNRLASHDVSSSRSSHQNSFEIPPQEKRYKSTERPTYTFKTGRSIDILRRESLTSLISSQRQKSGLSTVKSDRNLRSDNKVGDSINSSVSIHNHDSEWRRTDPEQTSGLIVIDDDDDDVSVEKTPQNAENRGASDSLASRNGEKSKRTSFLQSKYMNDENVEDERRARTEEQRRRKQLIEEEEAKVEAYEKKRRAQELSLEKKLKYQMRIFEEEPEVSEEIFYEEEKEEEETLPVLTEDMEEEIRRAWRNGNPGEVLAEGFRLQITRRDMATLGGLNWLNDEVGRVGGVNWLNDQVINFYMNMLMARGEKGGPKVYAFNTFFYPKIMSGGHAAVKRWTKKVDIFEMDYILIPVHLGMHWCLCVADMKNAEITYYDSMGAPNNSCLLAVLNYINDESIAKKGTSITKGKWKLINAQDNPQQMNGGDCGMFMCKYAEYITRGKPITFRQENMPYFRRRMVYEILTQKLLQ